MRSRLTIVSCVGVLLLAGATINVLIAWTLPRFGPMWIVLTADPATNTDVLSRDDPAVGELAADATLIGFGRQRFHGWGFDREVIYATDGVNNRSITRGRCGWPFRSLHGSDTTGVGLRNAVALPEFIPSRPLPGGGLHFLPTGILWGGFVANTVLCALALWLVLFAPFAWRRGRRFKRGLCPACAYPAGESRVCTECGRSLPQHRA